MSDHQDLSPTETLPVEGSILFFDLAGTLLEHDARLSSGRRLILQGLGQRARRIVLVTGQPFDDPQVREVLAALAVPNQAALVAYTTRGSRRFRWNAGAFETDLIYLNDHRLSPGLLPSIEREVVELLVECEVDPSASPECLDEVAVRIRIPPNERPRFVALLASRLARRGLAELQVVSEGRTSVFVMRSGAGKRRAVQYELDCLFREGITASAFYFGDEVQAGNDREVLGLPNLQVCALGWQGPPLINAPYLTIGDRPDDLYALLRRSMGTARHRS